MAAMDEYERDRSRLTGCDRLMSSEVDVTEEHTREVHVVPTADLIEHDMDSWLCLCGPAVATSRHEEHWDVVVTHHALDGREAYE